MKIVIFMLVTVCCAMLYMLVDKELEIKAAEKKRLMAVNQCIVETKATLEYCNAKYYLETNK